MPELPEVETIVRDVRPFILGKMITAVAWSPGGENNILKIKPTDFYENSMGEAVVTLVRKGKYILMPLTNDNVIVMHLGMTGRLLLCDAPVDEEGLQPLTKYTHVSLEFTSLDDEEDSVQMHFDDVRMFGNIWLAKKVNNINEVDIPGLKKLGPDALGITMQEFQQNMSSNRAIKSILLDQSKVAGVGNIYADEALFSANLHPSLKGSSLDSIQLARLWFAVKSVLKQGIRYRGSSVSDYTSIGGEEGSFQKHHRVYRKAGQKCSECPSVIERIKIAGRSTHFCPSCQKGD